MNTLTFHVPGVPCPQGSKTAAAFPLKTGGFSRPWLRDDNKKTTPWKSDVKLFAQQAVSQLGAWDMDGEFRVRFDFVFPRLKGHFGTGRNASKVKASAPRYHSVKPDRDKLERAIQDAGTGVLWIDDCRVVEWSGSKVYGDAPGCTITVERIERVSLSEAV